MSSLFKRSSWTLQFENQNRSPKRKQFSLRTTSKETAQRLKAELDDLYYRGLFDPWVDDFREALERQKRPEKPSESVALSEAKEQFLASKRGLSDSTYSIYETVTRLFAEHLGEVQLRDLSASDVASFLETRDLSLTSKHTYRRHLRVFFNWCGDQDWIAENPAATLSLQREPEKQPRAFTEEEVTQLIEGAEGHVQDLVVVGAYTGLRRAELSRLRWEEVSLQKREIYVGDTKSGKDRVVPLSQEVLKRIDARETGYVISRDPKHKIHVDTLSHEFLELRRAVFPHKKSHSLHSLRHSFCTWLAEAGTPLHVIKRLAGHRSSETTMQYIHSLTGGHEHIDKAFG
jgi:integrase